MRPVFRNVALVVIAVVVLVVTIGQPWRPSEQSFREDDPRGYTACNDFWQADGAGGDVYRTLMGRAASEGLRSTNERIRAAIDDGTEYRKGDPVIDDLGDFRSACKAAGYRFS